jgi:hypothetical protein
MRMNFWRLGIPFLISVSCLCASGAPPFTNYDDNNTEAIPDAESPGKNLTIEDARDLLLDENFRESASVYSRLLLKDTANIALNAELAYALALTGAYDASLFNLDKIRISSDQDPEINYYASQVYSLMGFDDLSSALAKTSGGIATPGWLSSKAPLFIQKYRRTYETDENPSGEKLVLMFKEANRLAAQNYNLRSIAVFEEITLCYPDGYLPYLGYSIVLEKAGMYEEAAGAIEKAIAITGESSQDTATLEVLDERLSSLQEKIAVQKTPKNVKLKQTAGVETANPGIMAYGGGNLSSGFTSLNAKIGIYYSDANYSAIEAGVASASGSNYMNLGFTTYNRQKIFVLGAGMLANLGGGTAIFYGKVSLGLSFMNKNHSSSFDIFIDGKVPFNKGYSTTMGLSVGQSIYFGKRK